MSAISLPSRPSAKDFRRSRSRCSSPSLRPNPHRPLPPDAAARRGADPRAKSCDRSAPFSTSESRVRRPRRLRSRCPQWRVFHPRRSSACRFRRRSVAGTLLQLAKDFRERGDTTNAIAKLQQATALDPGNAEILAELAMTYESMQLFDRSNEVWRRLQSLGPAAGPLFELADLKLQVGVPATRPTAWRSAQAGRRHRNSRRLDLRHLRVDLETRARSRRGDAASPARGRESAARHADRSHQGQDPGFLLRHGEQRSGRPDQRRGEL